jgi:hypothetical protein
MIFMNFSNNNKKQPNNLISRLLEAAEEIRIDRRHNEVCLRMGLALMQSKPTRKDCTHACYKIIRMPADARRESEKKLQALTHIVKEKDAAIEKILTNQQKMRPKSHHVTVETMRSTMLEVGVQKRFAIPDMRSAKERSLLAKMRTEMKHSKDKVYWSLLIHFDASPTVFLSD